MLVHTNVQARNPLAMLCSQSTNNSETMLLDWLTAHGNYASYRSGHGGLTKIQVCTKVANMINLKGVKKERMAEHIYKTIIRFEKVYRETLDWTNCTGQGVKESDPQSYEGTVIKRCPHFYTLAPIMGERANARCIVNSDIFRGVSSGLSSNDSFSDDGGCFSDDDKDETKSGYENKPGHKSAGNQQESSDDGNGLLTTQPTQPTQRDLSDDLHQELMMHQDLLATSQLTPLLPTVGVPIAARVSNARVPIPTTPSPSVRGKLRTNTRTTSSSKKKPTESHKKSKPEMPKSTPGTVVTRPPRG
jgi:hypothetical protein